MNSCRWPPRRRLLFEHQPIAEFPNSKGLRIAARTSGIINHISDGQTEIALQDGSAAIWMPMHVNRPRDLRLGQEVEVGGYLQKGQYAPTLLCNLSR